MAARFVPALLLLLPGLAEAAAGVAPPSVGYLPLPEAGRAPGEPAPAIIRRVDNDEMRIAITFDACATRSQGYRFDRAVYRVLKREGVPTTIFVSGRWVESHPDAMAVLAADPLIEFANHSYDHPDMQRLSDADIAAQFDRTEAALGRHGQRSVAFRPPFGVFNDRVLEIARDKQLPAVLWDVVSGDPRAEATAAEITQTVVEQTRSGSIVIFHINGRAAHTAAALPTILRQLRVRGFQFVHISTLLGSPERSKRGGHVVERAGVPEHVGGLDPIARGEDDTVLPLAADGISLERPARAARRLQPAAKRPVLVPARSPSPTTLGAAGVVKASGREAACGAGGGARCP